ncbi:hypothetical protein [Alkalicoccus luteus]|uniref:hypothetical protein n=1 Tax=Alkalicoccus luteus TaxID=1237094 RepID=UPI0040332547
MKYIIKFKLFFFIIFIGFTYNVNADTQDDLSVTDEERETIISDLKEEIDNGEVDSLETNPFDLEMEMNMTSDEAEESGLIMSQPQSASTTIGETTDEDGNEVTLNATLLSGSLKSRTAGDTYYDYGESITQNHYLEWYERYSNGYDRINLNYYSSSWDRSTAAFSVRNADVYTESAGRNDAGNYTTCLDERDIGTVSWSSNSSIHYADYICGDDYIEAETANPISRVTGDIYYNQRIVSSGFRTTVRPN